MDLTHRREELARLGWPAWIRHVRGSTLVELHSSACCEHPADRITPDQFVLALTGDYGIGDDAVTTALVRGPERYVRRLATALLIGLASVRALEDAQGWTPAPRTFATAQF